MRSSYILHRIRSAHSRLESLNTTLFLQCCTVCRDVAFCQQISENLMRNLLKLTEITSLRFSDELRALCLLQLDGMVGQPSLMTVLISLTIKVEERNPDEQQDVNLCFGNFKSWQTISTRTRPTRTIIYLLLII